MWIPQQSLLLKKKLKYHFPVTQYQSKQEPHQCSKTQFTNTNKNFTQESATAQLIHQGLGLVLSTTKTSMLERWLSSICKQSLDAGIHGEQLPNACNFSSKGPNTSFWPPQAPTHTHTFAHTLSLTHSHH